MKLITFTALLVASFTQAAVPAGYQGKTFEDECHKTGMPNIPGIIQCAMYDLGGEGIAYHDTTPLNDGSGKYNVDPDQQRAHANPYIWGFRRKEGVDISYVKDFLDLNHPNPVSPHINQLYIGWADKGEWTNYTVNVKVPGTYRIKVLYSYQPNEVSFDLNGKPASTCKLPVPTESWHFWNFAEIGSITFPEPGLQLLTFHYGGGNNFAYFEFEKVK